MRTYCVAQGTQCSLMTWVGKKFKKEGIYVYGAREAGSVPGLGRSRGVGDDNPLQYSCLENPTDRGTWWATVCGVAQSQTWLSDCTHTCVADSLCCIAETNNLLKHLYSSLRWRKEWYQPVWAWHSFSLPLFGSEVAWSLSAWRFFLLSSAFMASYSQLLQHRIFFFFNLSHMVSQRAESRPWVPWIWVVAVRTGVRSNLYLDGLEQKSRNSS